MISKSFATLFKQGTQGRQASLVTAHQRKFAGGGVKKPAMPAAETNFDLIVVGKKFSFLKLFRWSQRHCSD